LSNVLLSGSKSLCSVEKPTDKEEIITQGENGWCYGWNEICSSANFLEVATGWMTEEEL